MGCDVAKQSVSQRAERRVAVGNAPGIASVVCVGHVVFLREWTLGGTVTRALQQACGG